MIDLAEKELSLETSKLTPKYLVVDSNIVRTSGQQEFAGLVDLPVEAGIFVGSYEEALEVVRSDAHIVLAFVDVRVTKSSSQEELRKEALTRKNSKSHLKNEWGVKLLPQIKNIPTFIYYSSADKFTIREEAAGHENVIGSTIKPFVIRDLEVIKPYQEKYFPPEKYAPVSPSFDYSSLDQETLSFVQLRTKEIRRLVKRTSQDIVDIGRYLTEVKDRLGYGNFYPWLDGEFGWGSRTAIRFMRVAERFGQIDNLSDLNILSTALYVLSAPSTPVEATAEAIERAKQGEKISDKTAIAIKAKYKALKEQAKSKVQPKKVEQVEPGETENRESRLSVDSVSQPSSGLPEKRDQLKQEILAVVPSQKAVQNSWWQLGEHHRLFCGEPKSQEFLKRLPQDIGLSITFLPENDFSLVPSIKSIFSCAFRAEYEDLELDLLIKTSIRTTTKPNEIVVFNYIYYIELLALTEKLGCYFWVAEPDLQKCEKILAIWRNKGSVLRITS